MRRHSSWALLSALLTLFSSFLVPVPVAAQKSPALNAPTRKPAGRATRKVVPGTVVSANGVAGILKPDEGNAPLTVFLTPETRHYRSGTRTNQRTFLAGEKVVTRLAFYPDGTILVAEIWDPDVYAEMLRLRKEVVVGTVETPLPAGSASGVLVVKPEEEGALVSYRVTDKTYFYRENSLVSPAAYPHGSEVAVKPRALPSGGFMASIVAESPFALDIAYRDTLSVWEGILEKWDAPNFYFVIKRTDGVHRRVIFPKNMTITDEATRDSVKEKRLYGPAEVIGRMVKVRLTRSERPGDGGTRTAVQVTVGPGPLTSRAKEKTPEEPDTPINTDIQDYALFYQPAVDKPYRIRQEGKNKSQEITFDSNRSDTTALNSLLALSASVLHPNAEGKIILQGKLLTGSGMFVLRHWYLAPPIRKRIAKSPTEVEEFEVPSLGREDFRMTDRFDPKAAAFDPARYTVPLRKPETKP